MLCRCLNEQIGSDWLISELFSQKIKNTWMIPMCVCVYIVKYSLILKLKIKTRNRILCIYRIVIDVCPTCGRLQSCRAQCLLRIVQSLSCEYISDVRGQRVDRAQHCVWTKCGKSNGIVWWALGGNCDLVWTGSGDPGPSENHGLGCCWEYGNLDS